MRTLLTVGLAIGLAYVVLQGVGVVPNQYPLIVDYAEPPPKSWEEAAHRVHVIAVIRVTSSEYLDAATPATLYTAEIIELLKATGPPVAPGDSIAIRRLGGLKRGLLVEEAGFPAWRIGTKVLVFLSWWPPQGAYSTSLGPDGSFEVDETSGRIRSFARGPLASRSQGRLAVDVLQAVRASVR